MTDSIYNCWFGVLGMTSIVFTGKVRYAMLTNLIDSQSACEFLCLAVRSSNSLVLWGQINYLGFILAFSLTKDFFYSLYVM